MTVTYSSHLSNTGLANFGRLLFRWRGSIYKLLVKEMLIYWAFYFTLSFMYRFGLNGEYLEKFEKLCIFLAQYTNIVPLTFILGFYVNMVVIRWWNIYQTIAWPDRTVHKISSYICGFDDGSRLIRRTLARWLNLSNVLMLRDTSSAVRKRFPTIQHVTDAGFITNEEVIELDKFSYPSHGYWVPLRWCHELTVRSRSEGRITKDRFLTALIDEYAEYRSCVAGLLSYDWISVPLVYTQVVVIAVYSFFIASLFSRQYLRPEKQYAAHQTDLYFPFFTTMQFVFYMGWLKVAETLVNPLGEDDDDFEVNYIIDRNLKTSFLIVDGMFGRLPLLQKDVYWDDKDPTIPYTLESIGIKSQPQVTSQKYMKVTDHARIVVTPASPTALVSSSTGHTPASIKRGLIEQTQSSEPASQRVDDNYANRKTSWDSTIQKLMTVEESEGLGENENDETYIPLIDATPRNIMPKQFTFKKPTE